MSINKLPLFAAAGSAAEPVPYNLTDYEFVDEGFQELYVNMALVSQTTYFDRVNTNGIFIRPDGKSIFYLDGNVLSNNLKVIEIPLETAWDLKSVSPEYGKTYIENNSYQFFSDTGVGFTIQLKADSMEFDESGNYFYFLDASSDAIYQYTMATLWDLGTLSYTRKVTLLDGANSLTATALTFKPGGSSLFVYNTANDFILEYSLSTPWDISTVSVSPVRRVLNPRAVSAYTDPTTMQFKDDGTKLFLATTSGSSAYAFPLEFSLSTPWDITTITYVRGINTSNSLLYWPLWEQNKNYSMVFGNSGNYIFWFKQDGAIFRFDAISSWTLQFNSTPEASSVRLGAYDYPLGIVGRDRTPVEIDRQNGQKFYYISSEEVFEKSFTTSWDYLSTNFTSGGLYDDRFDYLAVSQATDPADFSIYNDGSKATILHDRNSSTDEVFRNFTLSPNWSFVGTTTATTQFWDGDAYPAGKTPLAYHFEDTNAKFYVAYDDNTIYQYNVNPLLPVPQPSSGNFYNFISIASLGLPSKTPATDVLRHYGMSVSPDGYFMYLIGNAEIYQMRFGTPWDITTVAFQKIVTFGGRFKISPGWTKFWFSLDGSYLIVYNAHFSNFKKYTLRT